MSSGNLLFAAVVVVAADKKGPKFFFDIIHLL